MRRIAVGERRARLGRRHRLATDALASDCVDVARSLVCLHATDPATVMVSAVARMGSGTITDVERALYEERSLVRMLGMRRTMFVVPVDAFPVVQASSTRAVAANERRRLVGFLEDSGVVADADADAWLREVERQTLAALRRRGHATASTLARDVEGLRTEVVYARGKTYESTQRITTRVVSLLAADGHIVRARPNGSWVSSQYQWAPAESWLPADLPDLSVEAAQAELVRQWLAAFGPGTFADLRWWTGWALREVKRAVAALDVAEVDLDGARGLVLADDLEPVPAPDPWVALLPALDATAMGWTERDWYLGPHRAALFDRSGNIGPTIWSEGRIVGGWGQRKGGEVALRLLEDIGAEAETALEGAAERLTATLGGVRVVPRFPTPLQRELAG